MRRASRPRAPSARAAPAASACGRCRRCSSRSCSSSSRLPRSTCAVDLRVERPVRQIHALDRVGERAPLERVRREPQPAVPRSDAVARLPSLTRERQHALGPKRILGLLVRNELRRAAELARLRLARRIEHRDRLAALASHLALVGLPAARCRRGMPRSAATRSCSTIAPVAVELRRRFRAAERADQRLLRRIPYRLGAARRTGELLLRRQPSVSMGDSAQQRTSWLPCYG